MSDLFDESIEFEILGGLDYSDEEKDKIVSEAYARGVDLEDFETWEEIVQALDGINNEE